MKPARFKWLSQNENLSSLSMDLLLYDRDLLHEIVKQHFVLKKSVYYLNEISLTLLLMFSLYIIVAVASMRVSLGAIWKLYY